MKTRARDSSVPGGPASGHDISFYGKAVFWVFLAAFLCLALVPSLTLVQSAHQYFQFLTSWDPGTLQVLHSRRLPHPGGRAARSGAGEQALPSPQVYFTEFRLHAPGAKSVTLAGDFNRWQPDALALAPSRGSRGDWEVLLPLPPGKYQYLFRVDGVWTPDPKSKAPAPGGPASGRWQGLATSIKQVP